MTLVKGRIVGRVGITSVMDGMRLHSENFGRFGLQASGRSSAME